MLSFSSLQVHGSHGSVSQVIWEKVVKAQVLVGRVAHVLRGVVILGSFGYADTFGTTVKHI